MEQRACSSCGGCAFRNMEQESYRRQKEENFKQTIARIAGASPVFDAPVFIDDGCRRRADIAFKKEKDKLILGFNEAKSHNIIDVEICPMLCSELNALLPALHRFLEEFCHISYQLKGKGRKRQLLSIKQGAVQLLNADNGIDITLILETEPSMEHRLLAAEFVNTEAGVLRLSWKIGSLPVETIVEKLPPELNISGCSVSVPQGVFLQASKQAETIMISTVLTYLGATHGRVADLFCGLGTFTYPLAKNPQNNVVSVDSNGDSLKGLQKAVNRNQLQNVTILNRNLFKYPLDASELKGIRALVIDPPRAGAHAQCREIAALPADKLPEKIIFVSCNPETFVCDAEILISADYVLERITLIDQFVYSKHQELIALFIYNPEDNKRSL